MPAITLEGFRVLMRPPRGSDWPGWFAARSKNRDHLKPFEPSWPENALSADFFSRRIEKQVKDWGEGRGNYFLIIDRTDGALIGGMNINNITRGAAQYASLGYWIDRDREGQGYMAESLRLTLAYCFENLKLHRVHAACLLHNERSRALLGRAGFAEEGRAEKYLQIDGKWQDHVLYGLPYESWLKNLRQPDRQPDHREKHKA